MFNVLLYAGLLVFLLIILGWPILAYRQYTQSNHYNIAELVRVILLACWAVFALLLLTLTATHIISTTNFNILVIACLDAQYLINWWTSPDEKWVARRKRRRSFIIMLILSVILAVALVGILITNL